MQPLEISVIRFLETLNIDFENKSILVAVSGGVDSVALLHFCTKILAPKFSCEIKVAHVDHNLRQDSKKEYDHVYDLCQSRGIKFFGIKLNPGERLGGASIENWGRKKRYSFFNELMLDHRIDYVLTAHHLNDQLETLFMRLNRGTGLRGEPRAPRSRGRSARDRRTRTRAGVGGFRRGRDPDTALLRAIGAQ